MIIVLMGVSGAGKTTLGQALGEHLGWPFYDGDDFHPPTNVQKMAAGAPLTDEDRHPWLLALAQLIRRHHAAHTPAIVACSALKASYRALLLDAAPVVELVHLKANEPLLKTRMQERTGHFMKARMLSSQFEALEEPTDALVLDASLPVPQLVAHTLGALGIGEAP